jgi:uncharacterized membrane protein
MTSASSSASQTEETDPGARAPGLWVRFKQQDWLFKAILVIALIGTIEAAYLTYIHYYGLNHLACFGGSANHPSSCVQVQGSAYAKLVGIPVALLGLLSYITILVSLRIRGELGRGLGLFVSSIGFVFSLYLTYREIFTLHEICEWCVASATWMTLLTIFTCTRYLRGERSQGFSPATDS